MFLNKEEELCAHGAAGVLPHSIKLKYSSKRIFIKYFYSRKSDLLSGVTKQAFIL